VGFFLSFLKSDIEPFANPHFGSRTW